MPERIRLAREIRGLFKPVACYHPKYHKFRPDPAEQITRAFALTGDAKPYRLHRDLYSRLYDALQKSSVERAYIEAMWGDPYLHTITHWAAIPQERRESLRKEYPEMQDLAEEVEEAKRELAPDLLPASYDAQAFVNDIAIVGLSILNRGKTSKVAATSGARALAYIAPKCEKIASSISRETRIFCRKVENFFKKKAGKPAGEEAKKRVIPTAQSKVDWHVKMVKSGKWKPCHGEWRGYYEGKAPNDTRVYRFKPTFEKHEYEVYREYENKGLHCGVFRTEGGRALEVIEELAKWTFRGKW